VVAPRPRPEPHWHLGPVAVDSHLHNQGIGAAMMADFCARMDGRAALSYLETDKSENVHFYQTFGYTVVAEGQVLGVPNWFVSRPARVGGARRAHTAAGWPMSMTRDRQSADVACARARTGHGIRE
jgi:hypothetical protein